MPAGQRWPVRLWIVLAVLCTALFLDGLDLSIASVALPSIGSDLGLSTASLQWVVNAYVLGYGGLLLFGGRIADLLGGRRVFLIALGVFAAASVFGGLVHNGDLLIVSRFVKGVAAAFTAPTGLAILLSTFRDDRSRNRALSIFTIFGASGFASGLIIGGLLTSLGWQWDFLIPVPLALAALIAGVALIAKDGPAARARQDLGGAVTLVAGTLLAVYAVVSAPSRGWGDSLTIALLAIALIMLIAFVIIENKVAQPLVRLAILKSGPILRANLSMAALFGSFISFQFIMTLYLQDGLHWSPLRVAVGLVPGPAIVALGSLPVARLIPRFGTGPLIGAALTFLSAGYLWMRIASGHHPTYGGVILPTMVLLGIGFAFGYSAIMGQATYGVAPQEHGLASGLVQSSGQIGTAFVLAVTTAVISIAGRDFTSFRPGLNLVLGIALAGLLLNVAPLLARRRSLVPA
ncbi:MFS transporter [Actinoplanes sp. TBRC 11911]|uniref:MFS transporter n=1 Tax=Actinoplanes sp. TBRC 11911 TaxID=2729386 RepID=UPI0028968A40|nr:MFS transporter [Actinoplanes sp. TBRC 11911]